MVTNGPVRVSANGRYFVDQDGRPAFWLGDTQWQLFRDFTPAEAGMILENRRNKGFTAIQVMITGVGDGTTASVNGHTPWLNNDPATPNEDYFKNVDNVLQMDHQVVFVLGVYHQVQVARITTANARTYAKWIAQRYRDVPNIIWAAYPKAEPDYVPVLQELAAGLREGDEGAHLITIHPDPSPASSSFIHNEDWLDFNMIQTWAYYKDIYKMVTNDYNLTPAKPVVMAEGAYEDGPEYGFPVTPLMIRRQAYWSYLSGGHHSYGHNDNWRIPQTWKASLDAPGAIQMGVLKEIFTAREWWNLMPDQSFFADRQDPDMTLNTAARSELDDWAMVYLSNPTAVSINMGRIAAGDMVKASWISPLNGTKTGIGNFPNTDVHLFSTPGGWEDAILLLESC